MRKAIIIWISTILMAMTAATGYAAFTEPNMADYTAVPLISNQSVPPNVMIMLDNSGSMNFNAYGTYPGDYKTVTDMPYTGEPYNSIKTFPMISGQDDAEEGTAAGSVLYHNHSDLDLGGFSVATNDALVGIRFQNVEIPQGATIESAYIEFNANASNAEVSNFLIEGEASDDAAPFALVADDLKSRTATAATVTWADVQAWTAGQYYPTADISTIVQEIVNRGGWSSGNSIVFRFSGTGGTDNKRDVRSYNSSSSMAPKLHVVFGGNPAYRRYYGYFSPDHFYNYDGSKFNLAYKKIAYDKASSAWKVETLGGASTSALTDADIVNNKLWDGNWLNWLCMRRVDVLRKVLMGGLATARSGGGNQVNYGETPKQSSRVFNKIFDDSVGSATSPYAGTTGFRMQGGDIQVDTDLDGGYNNGSYHIWIQKDDNYEPNDFKDGNLAGVLQRVGDKARWGNTWFNAGTGSNESGARVANTIGTNMLTLITTLQNTGMDTWTPLAESYYVAMQYFKQEDPAAGYDYPNNAVPNSNLGDDPYYNGVQHVACAKSFAILLTDGASTKDAMIPSTYLDYDKDNNDGSGCTENNCVYPSGGSDYLDDIALYARTRDLRPDLDGDQNLILYAIHAFDKDPNATGLLSDAARNGGFDDMNGNKIPDLVQEYDKDGDGLPDTFFEADDGYAIEAKLLAAITDILKRASSGTAASVLATNSEGEGNMLQAYYLPYVTEGLEEARWYGFVQSLWVDSYGSLYEDSNQNRTFDSADEQISFTTDADNDTAFIRNGQTIKLNETDPALKLKPIFEVGSRLSQKNPNTRKIFTFIDQDNDGMADEVTNDPFDTAGELITFDTGTGTAIKPYLGVADDTTWGDNGAKLGSTHDNRTNNLITWVRGTDVSGLRNRTLGGVTWPLGDIIHSTPVSVSRPVERFHLWYADTTYRDFYDMYKDRESVVYVGGNDGMLHAFASWQYDNTLKQYQKPLTAPADEEIGDELWAFIPQSVLPHLKWTAHADYSHTYLVDAKPRVFDAKIIEDGTHYNDADTDDDWGTILVMGMNMGAKTINVNEDFNDGNGVVTREFDPTYICMDVTEPRAPRLLWERSYPNQAMSYATPIPVKVGDQWYLVFGSGPTDYDGSSTQDGYLFVVDMKTGDLFRQFGPFEDQAFFGTAASIDKNLNYNVDAIYVGNTHWSSNRWQGGLYKIAIPCSNCEWDASYNPSADFGYDMDPANWTVHKIFDSKRPITAPPSISVETYPSLNVDNVWVYFGTGRYLSDADKLSTDQEYLYAIKDPFFNTMYSGTTQHDYAGSAGITLTQNDLFAGDSVITTTDGFVLDSGTFALHNGSGYFTDLVDEVRLNYDGWYYPLETNGSLPSERMISKPAIFGGISFFATFTPSTEICKNAGTTNFYALYYITGTGYTKQILNILNPSTVTFTYYGNSVTQEVVAVKLEQALIGAPPPSVGLHTGKEEGAKAYIQLSTGVVELIDVDSAIYMKSVITDWWDRTD
ncbi:MAG: PilC/PilY family type IV pilus protein [Desulfobacteraceae bacterium]